MPYTDGMRLLIIAVFGFLPPISAVAAPRLLTVIVVDQLKPETMPRSGPGFGRLLREGFEYSAARHGHLPTETAPGHAALLTGRFPMDSGIVANEWWDAAAGRRIESPEDPAGGPSGAQNLLVPTLGDLMKERNPVSATVSVAAKDRSAALMGGRSADLALWFNKTEGAFASSSRYPSPPAWVKDFNLKLAIPVGDRPRFPSTTAGDAAALALALRAVKEQGLGRDGAPDLLTVSLAANDLIGHANGPQSPEAAAHLAALDALLADFLKGLDASVGRGKHLVVLSSDHGCLPTPESREGAALGARRVKKADLQAAVEASLVASLGRAPAGRWVRRLSAPHLTLDGGAPAAARAVTFLRGRSEVAQAFLPGDAAMPAPLRRAVYAGRSGDVLFTVKPGVLLTDDGSDTSHGTHYDYDARVPLLLAGAGVRPGRSGRDVLSVDLAPTLAGLLGVPLAFTDGAAPLAEAFAPQPAAVPAVSPRPLPPARLVR